MARGTRRSNWRVAFHPLTGDHLDYDGQFIFNPDWKFGQDNGNTPRTLAAVYRDADYTFEATLRFVKYEKGRSRVSFYFEDVRSGVTYVMQLAEFARNVPRLMGGQLAGKFGFVKNGTSTGIVLLDGSSES